MRLVRTPEIRTNAGTGLAVSLASLLTLLGAGCISALDHAPPPDGTGGTTTAGTGGRTGGSGGATGTGGVQTGGTGGHTGSGGATGTGGAQTGGTGGRTGSGGAAGAQTGSGGAGSGGNAGSPGSGGQMAGTGGASGPSSCVDGMMNGNETGVDCGGSCPACPTYKINPPNLNNKAQSGCNGGTGFMCTRSMVFSPEFKQAAMDDWSSGNPPFVYGVVGHDKDSGGLDGQSGNTCCQCYQLVFESPKDNVTGLPTPKPMIVQAFNTAAGGAKNFDVYMATGGEGANTAGCSAMYDVFPTTGEPNNGGIRPLNFTQQCAASNKFTEDSIAATMCQSEIATQCDMITTSASPSNQSASQNSCIETNQPANLYHLNWNVRAERVECPVNLTRVTGCKLNNQGLPQPDPKAQDVASAGSGFVTGYGTTTMQDCCRPTCAYVGANNVAAATADPSYGIFYTCDKAGNPQ
jgi:hypothetical protein